MAKQNQKFSSEEIAAFCEQIAIILNGGIPLYEGIYILYEEIEDKNVKEVIKKIDESLKDNQSFHQALKDCGVFPSYMVNMVRIGELTGKLESVMYSLASYYDRESVMKANVRNVITYPIMMFAMMAVVLLVLVFRILPLFERVFLELSVEAANSSNAMMSVGVFAGKVVAVAALSIFAIVIFLVLWYRTKSGKKILQNIGDNFFLTKKLSEMMAIGKFISAMALMTMTGIERKEALEMSSEIISHKKVKKKVEKCTELVAENVEFEEVLKKTKLITGMQGRMISIGARTGVLDVVLQELSKRYDEDIEIRLSGLCTKIETILVVSLSCVVGAILISIMLPLVSIISSIG